MMSEAIKIVCATDDGIHFSSTHFGSAKKYRFYFFDTKRGEISFLKEIENVTPEENSHFDPEKARMVSKTLDDAEVIISTVFGPNIARMRKRFIPIVSKEKNILAALEELKDLSADLNTVLAQSGDKKIFRITGSK